MITCYDSINDSDSDSDVLTLVLIGHKTP